MRWLIGLQEVAGAPTFDQDLILYLSAR